MPPRNTGRSLFSEDALSARVGYERERRGWTYEGLAKRMTDAGCPINQSAIYKIEKGEPRRRITVDELVALSQVFDLPAEELLLPPDLAKHRVVVDALQQYEDAARRHTEARQAEERAREAEERARERFYELCNQWPDAGDALANYLRDWSTDPRSRTMLPPGGPQAWLEQLAARRGRPDDGSHG